MVRCTDNILLLLETTCANCSSPKGFSEDLNLSFIVLQSPFLTMSVFFLSLSWWLKKPKSTQKPPQPHREVQLHKGQGLTSPAFLFSPLFPTHNRHWNNKSRYCNIRRQSDFQQPLWGFISRIWCQRHDERWAEPLLVVFGHFVL